MEKTMAKIFEKYKTNIENSISEIRKNSKKNLNISFTQSTVVGVFISIVVLKLTRPIMIKLPSAIFYIIVVGILITPFIISILKMKTLHRKYTKRIDKNIKNIYKNLDEIDKEYKEKLIEKINQIDSTIKIRSVSAITTINDDKTVEYIFKKETLNAREDVFSKEVCLDNEEKVRYLDESISLIEEFQNTPQYRNFKTLCSGKIITQYLPDCDYKQTIDNFSTVFSAMDNYYNQRKQTLLNLRKPLELGLNGEEYVNRHLEIYEDEIINLPNIRLEVAGNSIENDNILITRKGIFVLEVKNIGTTGSYSILVENNGRWLKKFSNKPPEVMNFNATVQNDRHIAILQKFLNNKLNRSIQKNNYLKAEGIVVIANENLDLKNESMQNIYRVSEIYRFINTFDDVLTYSEMLEIKEIILKENLKPKKYPILDYKSEIKNNTNTFNSLISRRSREKRNLRSIYEFFDESGYIEYCDWVSNINISSDSTLSKLNNSVRKINVPTYILKELGYIPHERSANTGNIEINIKKHKPKVKGLVFTAILSAVIASGMNLLYKPGELYPVNIEGKYGYQDEKGKIRIKPVYDNTLGVQKNGLAAVKLNRRWGFIDKLGREVTDFKYDDIKSCSNGAVAVKLGGKWGFINSKGKEVIKPKYYEIEGHPITLAAVKLGGKWGFIDSKGKEIVNPKYDDFDSNFGKQILVKLGGKWGVIDSNGKEVIKPTYDKLVREKNLNIILLKLNGVWGLVAKSENDKNKYKLVQPRYERVRALSLDSRFINYPKNSEYVELDEINNELLKVKDKGKQGLVNAKTLEVVLNPVYEDIGPFTSGLAPVKINGKWGFMDSNYKVAITPQFDKIEAAFDKHKAHVVKDGEYYMVYKDGRIQEYVSVAD